MDVICNEDIKIALNLLYFRFDDRHDDGCSISKKRKIKKARLKIYINIISETIELLQRW